MYLYEAGSYLGLGFLMGMYFGRLDAKINRNRRRKKQSRCKRCGK